MFDLIDSEKCFSKGISPYKLISGEFDVCSPYFQTKKTLEPPHKKQKSMKSNTERETEERHQTIRTQLLACLDQLAEEWPAQWKERQTPTTQNTEAETVDFPSMAQMVEMAHQKFSFDTTEEEAVELKDQTVDLFSVFGTVYRNSSDTIEWLPLTMTAKYLIPPHSTFLMGSMENTMDLLGNYVQKRGGADLIVMDPPWPNKSVHRSSHYDTQDIYDLYKIPMLKLISKKSLVAIWVTNKPKFRKFILDKLLPAWQLECVAEWVWLKTTTQAESVCPLDSPHKKPYEQLILARPIHSASSSSMPKTHTLISVPSVRHSRKPPLEDILLPWIDSQEPICLELFARCLMPGWISWGNECLRFQHANYFERQ